MDFATQRPNRSRAESLRFTLPKNLLRRWARRDRRTRRRRFFADQRQLQHVEIGSADYERSVVPVDLCNPVAVQRAAANSQFMRRFIIRRNRECDDELRFIETVAR